MPPTQWMVKVAQPCPTLWDPMDYTVHGILQAIRLEWVAFPRGKGKIPFLQGIFPTQGSSPSLPRCRRSLYQLSPQVSIMSIKLAGQMQKSKKISSTNSQLFLRPRRQFLIFSASILLENLSLGILMWCYAPLWSLIHTILSPSSMPAPDRNSYPPRLSSQVISNANPPRDLFTVTRMGS